MTRFSDYASIAATTAGVSGNINVPRGARLVGLDLNYTDADGVVSIIELTAPGFPQPLRFTPNIAQQVFTTPGGSITMQQSPMTPLDLVNGGGTVVTVKVTSTANLTVVVGLSWEA